MGELAANLLELGFERFDVANLGKKVVRVSGSDPGRVSRSDYLVAGSGVA